MREHEQRWHVAFVELVVKGLEQRLLIFARRRRVELDTEIGVTVMERLPRGVLRDRVAAIRAACVELAADREDLPDQGLGLAPAAADLLGAQ